MQRYSSISAAILVFTQFAAVVAQSQTPHCPYVKLSQWGGDVQRAVMRSDYVYAVAGPKLIILSSANLTLTELSELTLPAYIDGIEVDQSYAYVIAGGLHVIDISTPTAPREVASVVDTTNETRPRNQPVLANGFLFTVAGVADARHIITYDVRDPTAPTIAGESTSPLTGRVYAAMGDYVIAAFGSQLQFWNISEPQSPQFISELSWQDNNINHVTVVGSYAYVSASDDRPRIVDIHDPQSPKLVGYIGETEGGGALLVSGQLLVTGQRLDEYSPEPSIYSIANPINPILFENHINSLGRKKLLALADTKLLVYEFGALRLVTLEMPGAPRYTDSFAGLGPVGGKFKVARAGSQVCLAAADYGLKILTIEPDNQLRMVGQYELPPDGFMGYINGDTANGVQFDGRYAYLQSDSLGLVVIDCEDPSNPQVVSISPFYGTQMLLGNNILIFPTPALHESLITIVDIADPRSPRLASSLEYFWGMDYTFLVGNYLLVYRVYSGSGFDIVSIENPESPVTITRFAFSDPPYDVAEHSGILYILTSHSIVTIDISDPAHPVELPNSFDVDSPRTIVFMNEIAYISSNHTLSTYDVSDPLNPLLLTTTEGGSDVILPENGSVLLRANNAALRLMAQRGDIDGNGIVAISDLATLLANYGLISGATLEQGDLDNDGDVDASDLSQLLAAYGSECP